MVCPERGIYEFIKVAAPKTTPRSWLLLPCGIGYEAQESSKEGGYITKTADLFITTPIDPIFFLLPAMAPRYDKEEPVKPMFLSSDDYFEKMKVMSPDFSGFLSIKSFRTSLERRLAVICDTVEAGDEIMFRMSEEKLLGQLLHKAKRMVREGLPTSMENKLIRKALEVPMMSIKREDSSKHVLAIEEQDNGASTETPDSQSSTSTVNSASTSFSGISTVATSISEEALNIPTKRTADPRLPSVDAPQQVVELLRLRTAFLFICSNYIFPNLASRLNKALSTPTSPTDFKPLNDHLAHLAKLRQEALAARSIGDYSRKRAIEDDDETLEIRAEKKRRKEEEDKRQKAGVSVGLKKLQKVNTTGMKKMSDFFKKK